MILRLLNSALGLMDRFFGFTPPAPVEDVSSLQRVVRTHQAVTEQAIYAVHKYETMKAMTQVYAGHKGLYQILKEYAEDEEALLKLQEDNCQLRPPI